MRLIRLRIDPDKVNGPRSPRRGTHMRQFLSQQRIDQARFAHVRAAEEGKLRRTFPGKGSRVGRRCDEFGENRFQRDSVPRRTVSRQPFALQPAQHHGQTNSARCEVVDDVGWVCYRSRISLKALKATFLGWFGRTTSAVLVELPATPTWPIRTMPLPKSANMGTSMTKRSSTSLWVMVMCSFTFPSS